MKVFRAVTERDGETTKEAGKTSTEVVRSEYRYAADTIGQVWGALATNLPDDEQLVAIHEEHPAITVLAL